MKKDCPICQSVDELAPSKSYCPEHDYTNEKSPGKTVSQQPTEKAGKLLREKIADLLLVQFEQDTTYLEDANTILSLLRKEIEGMKKKQYCGWGHDDAEQRFCPECIAVKNAFSALFEKL